jgi:GTP pyrophosphokinase
MKRRNKPFDEIYDLMAIRVIVKSVQECYHVLGVIHHKWTPLQERIKDYIASPKSNAYQSLHTTVFGPGGHLFEVQIRTQEMHRTAEYGIAAHWLYKDDGKRSDLDSHFGWFRQLLELQQDAHTPEEFLEFLKVDLFQDEIFVFTPRGDVKQLPKGATPIDLAFMVHTDVGMRCIGAKVNGRIAPLHRELRNGDTVEILTGPSPRPSRDWLAHVRTGRARHKIKAWIRHQEDEEAQTLGRELLARECRRRVSTARPGQLARAPTFGLGRGLEIGVGRGCHGDPGRRPFPDVPAEDVPEPRPCDRRVIERIRLSSGIGSRICGLMVRMPSAASRSPATPWSGTSPRVEASPSTVPTAPTS